MIQPNDKVLSSILSLQSNKDFQEIIAWLKRSLAKVSIDNNHCMGELTIKNQGRGLELQEITDAIEGAQAAVDQKKKQETHSGFGA